MATGHKRIERERQTVRLMIGIYCRNQHKAPAGSLCADCRELTAYAMERLDRCRYQESKPTCARCPIHCYHPAMRQRIRGVMRHAGPRMMLHHPLLTVWHWWDGRKR